MVATRSGRRYSLQTAEEEEEEIRFAQEKKRLQRSRKAARRARNKQRKKERQRSRIPFAKMEPDAEEKPLPGGAGGWAQYASSKSMTQFGNVIWPRKGEKPVAIANTNVKHNEGIKSVAKLHASMLPREPVWLGDGSPGAIVKCHDTQLSSFGVPSPPRDTFNKPLWVQTDIDIEITRHQRSLEDIYNENPDLKLEARIDSGTMHLAAEIIRQLVDEAVCRWLNNWCPHMDFREVLEAVRATTQGGDPGCKRYNVPLGAIDSGIVTAGLVEMYQHCQTIVSKEADDIQFSHLLGLIDQSVVFLKAIKDTNVANKLQKTKHTIQWFPIGIDAKKIFVLRNANAELDKLNHKYSRSVEEGEEVISGTQHQKRRVDELGILDRARVEFGAHCEAFDIEMFNELCGLLAWQGD